MENTTKQMLSTILIVAQSPFRAGVLKRITKHLKFKTRKEVSSIEEAEAECMKKKPDLILVDVSDMKSEAFTYKLEPFLLSIPGWIRTLLVDAKPSVSRVQKAAKLGVHGILKAPFSHHGLNTLLGKVGPKRKN